MPSNEFDSQEQYAQMYSLLVGTPEARADTHDFLVTQMATTHKDHKPMSGLQYAAEDLFWSGIKAIDGTTNSNIVGEFEKQIDTNYTTISLGASVLNAISVQYQQYAAVHNNGHWSAAMLTAPCNLSTNWLSCIEKRQA